MDGWGYMREVEWREGIHIHIGTAPFFFLSRFSLIDIIKVLVSLQLKE